ncbi:MAG: hypothetical protein ACFFD1_05670 [Candidatus Thorarchaeota archaeon]
MYALFLVLIVLILWYIKKTNENCPQTFKVPNRQLFLPVRSAFSSPNSLQQQENTGTESLNDQVNEHYMGNPYFLRKAGMGDITKGMWESGGSEAKKSNDGRLNEEYHAASDTITPEYRNTVAAKTHDLYAIGSNKSRMENFEYEGNSPSHPWSQYKN